MEESEKITAQDILGLLAERYSDSQRYACAAEVSPRTGAWERRIDFLAMWCWQSDMYKIEGFEIKVSKSDLRRELQDPDKHAVFFEEIDFYWLAAPSDVIGDMSLLPPKWGVMKVVRGNDGKLSLEVARKPCCLHDDKINARPISKNFMASVFRAVGNQSHTKAALYREHRAIEEEIRKSVENEITNGGRVVSECEYSDLLKYRGAGLKYGIHHWRLSEYDIKAFNEARLLLDRIRNLVREIGNAESSIRSIKRSIKTLLEGSAATSAAETLGKLSEESEGQ